MTFYAQRKSIVNGQPVAPNNRYGTQEDMQYQYYLYCASAVKNEQHSDFDAIEWGTIEQGMKERSIFRHEAED